MAQTIRVTKSGYDASTETNIDNYALYADADNILIKEFARGSGSCTFARTVTIDHDLGYIPAFIVWGEIDTDTYRLINCQSPIGGGWKVYATTSDLVIENAYSDVYTDYRYFIFYDDMSGSGTPSITESDVVVKVSKSGVEALSSTNPNDYIFHSDLNTFKILGEGVLTGQEVDSDETIFLMTHGQSTPPAVYGFAKFADGYVSQSGSKARFNSMPPIQTYWRIEVDDTYVRFIFYKDFMDDPYDVDVKYYVFEVPAL